MDRELTAKLVGSGPTFDGTTRTFLRVAIVDDNNAFAEALGEFLADDPRVRVVGRAVSGHEAQARVPIWNPDLVLLDLCLPDRNGLESAQALKRLPNPPHVVIMTIHESMEYPVAARAAGANGFLGKAAIAAELPKLIDRLCAEQGIGRRISDASTTELR